MNFHKVACLTCYLFVVLSSLIGEGWTGMFFKKRRRGKKRGRGKGMGNQGGGGGGYGWGGGGGMMGGGGVMSGTVIVTPVGGGGGGGGGGQGWSMPMPMSMMGYGGGGGGFSGMSAMGGYGAPSQGGIISTILQGGSSFGPVSGGWGMG